MLLIGESENLELATSYHFIYGIHHGFSDYAEWPDDLAGSICDDEFGVDFYAFRTQKTKPLLVLAALVAVLVTSFQFLPAVVKVVSWR